MRHWGTDGEWKEVALRSVLRRRLPESVNDGRGFVVTQAESSTQIDISVVDASKPALFKDGDLLVVTPDAVRGVIEVKTPLRAQSLVEEALSKLSRIENICRDATGNDQVWTGLFIFEGKDDIAPRLLGGLSNAYETFLQKVNCVSEGRNTFVRYWERGADVYSLESGPVWHAYTLPEVAPSYFMGKLIDFIGSVDNSTADFAWFPMLGGKEQHRTYNLPLGARTPLPF